jgi:uncharacterized protein YgiM (DUF1202 family)
MSRPDSSSRPPTWSELTVDRRVVLKTAALFGALLSGGFLVARRDEAEAQSTTRAVDWYVIDQEPSVQAAGGDGFITIEAEFPFTAVGASWSGVLGTWPQVEIRMSADGVNYSDIIVLVADVDNGLPERDGRVFTRLAFSNGDTFIQYRVIDQDGDPVSIDSFGLTYIDASAGPTLGEAQLVEAADISTPPGIISRTGWGADESLRFSNGVEIFPPQYATIRHGIVHHSETPNADDPAAQMRSIYYYHAVTRAWGDIGYNYLVDKFGNIYQGRVGGQGVIGNHSMAHNVGAVGVCLIGNHLVQNPTPAAVSGVVAILAFALRGLDPLGFSDSWDLIDLPTICGHRDVNDTTCPGDFAYDDLAAIRNSVAQTQANPPPGPPGGFIVGDVVAIATDDGANLNLRSAPGTGSSVSGQLPDGSIAGVVAGPTLATGTNWYRVNASAGDGWVSAEFLQLAPAGAINSARFAVGDTIRVSAGSAALRGQPKASGALLSTIATGTEMWVEVGPRFRDGIVWYQVSGIGGDSRYGWTDQSLYQKVSSGPPDTTPPQPGDSVITTSAVNFRIGPTTSAAIITLLPMGTTGTVLGGPTSANGYNWYQLQTAYGIGWCAGSFLRKTASGGTTSPTPTRTPAPSRTPSPTPPPGTAFAVGDTVRSTSSVNFRTSPSLSGGLLRTLSVGTSGTVLAGPTSANGYLWYQLQISGVTGWAAGEFFVKISGPTQSPTPAPTVPTGGIVVGDTVRTISSANMRSGPSLTAGIVTTLPAETTGTVVAGPTAASGYNWYRIQTATQIGWVAHTLLAKTAPPSTIQVGDTVRTSTSLRLRSTASTSGTVIATMPEGTMGTVLAGPTTATGHVWYRLQTSLGTGWAAGEYLRKV